ncbi:putative nucleotidyltransferase-like protein [Stella humosa]|uniref:Putative nucleotidyltransferase-like protein n=1 Tax=Stella humosa TaxID=94 RepID=A0A3N1KZW5_9PROT|nr:nucleotidyltransferase family protein [Stella humosa]ROP83878.1 putative nucleotidyltransferase-like protein [Stella humosa]BBK32860.1 hypothetical protein STHU_34940 [Stella humosa]
MSAHDAGDSGILPPGMITPVQEQLLAIIYGPREEAAALFADWDANVDMTAMDDGCYRLYPLLYQRLRDVAPDHPFLGRLKGMFRRSYYRNNLLFGWACEILRRFRAEGIECIFLKGAALVQSTTMSAGFRPMADVDLLVRPADARRAMAVADARFRPVLDDPLLGDLHLELRHGYSVMDENRLEIDLHWRLAGTWAAGPDPDRPFWDTAERFELFGIPALTLAPTELLYHGIVHGIPRNPVPTIRWISDSLDILALEEERIDWQRLVDLAGRQEQRIVVRTALAYLRRKFSAPVPDFVLAALAVPYGPAEYATFALRARSWGAAVRIEEVRALLPGYLAIAAERLPGRRRIAFLPDDLATPAMRAWVRSLGLDLICEHAPQSPTGAAVRAAVLASSAWRQRFERSLDGLFRCDFQHVAQGSPPAQVYVSIRPAGDGKWAMRAFDTSLADWPTGAVVFRCNAAMAFLHPGILGVDDVLPTPMLSGWTGFPDAVPRLA